MKNSRTRWYALIHLMELLIGVILFWSFGKDWLDVESAYIFLAGLIGVGVAVFAFGLWNIPHN